MRLTLGFSPCPNDTYIFHGLVSGRTPLPGYEILARPHDVETLNEMAFAQALDVTKLSFYAWLRVKENYRLLSSGGALGYGCGPVVVSARPLTREDLKRCVVALPGRWTTAHLLLRLWAPVTGGRVFAPYNRIFDTIRDGAADCGVIIHESRFTFKSLGFFEVADLGAWWETRTGLPIPLGCIAVHNRVPVSLDAQLEGAIRRSIEDAQKAPEKCLPYIRSFAQEMTADVLQSHIDSFVNAFSMDLGHMGRSAVAELEARARQAGIVQCAP